MRWSVTRLSDAGDSRRAPLRFVTLVFLFAIPFWIVAALVERSLPLPMGLPVSALQVCAPAAAALILARWEGGAEGVKELLGKLTRAPRGTTVIWCAAAASVVPGIYGLSFLAMRLGGQPLPEPHIPWLTAPLLFAVYLVAAAAEEIGWMAYAFDRIARRWHMLAAAAAIGLVWGAFHVVADVQNGHGFTWVLWQRGVYDIALRILMVWLYCISGRVLVVAVLAHAADNVSVSLFPNGGSHYDPVVTGTITTILVVSILLLWSRARGPAGLTTSSSGGP